VRIRLPALELADAPLSEQPARTEASRS
jgi:hypothetical protein